MKAIAKGAEPASLPRHRMKLNCDYDNYPDKDALRRALVTEQRGICCYCMGRIRSGPDTMKIEHWHCQTKHPTEQLKYRNLLGACLGGHGQPWHLQHCDTRKGDDDIRWNPADPAHRIETRIRYEMDGSIRSDDTAFDKELDTVLNLNLPRLKNNRKGVLDGILGWWRQERGRGSVSRSRLKRECDYRVGGIGELEPFCQVTVWWIEQRLERKPA